MQFVGICARCFILWESAYTEFSEPALAWNCKKSVLYLVRVDQSVVAWSANLCLWFYPPVAELGCNWCVLNNCFVEVSFYQSFTWYNRLWALVYGVQMVCAVYRLHESLHARVSIWQDDRERVLFVTKFYEVWAPFYTKERKTAVCWESVCLCLAILCAVVYRSIGGSTRLLWKWICMGSSGLLDLEKSYVLNCKVRILICCCISICVIVTVDWCCPPQYWNYTVICAHWCGHAHVATSPPPREKKNRLSRGKPTARTLTQWQMWLL